MIIKALAASPVSALRAQGCAKQRSSLWAVWGRNLWGLSSTVWFFPWLRCTQMSRKKPLVCKSSPWAQIPGSLFSVWSKIGVSPSWLMLPFIVGRRLLTVRFSLLIDYSWQRSLSVFSILSAPKCLPWKTSLPVSSEARSKKRWRKTKTGGESKALLPSTITPLLPSGTWAKILF